MSLIFGPGTKPEGLSIKVYGFGAMGNTVYLGDYEISLEDFLLAADYILTNTDLEKNDPRLQFLKYVQSMTQVDGYNSGEKRLASSEPPVSIS